jgi:hypothetical protein
MDSFAAQAQGSLGLALAAARQARAGPAQYSD